MTTKSQNQSSMLALRPRNMSDRVKTAFFLIVEGVRMTAQHKGVCTKDVHTLEGEGA